VVQPGETLWEIAGKYNLTWEELNKFNELENPRMILPGQTILIPSLP